MARATIDFGIDLGTTNSEIALMNRGSMRVFKAWDNRENTPSVVRILSDGTIQVGKNAYDRLVDDEENTVAEFKRLMGRSHTYHFADSGRTLTPEELSSEVLKILKADVVLAGFDCTAAVITVPAYFEIVQSEATQRAARLAGLPEAPLLQEPIAAAIAYGKDAPPQDGYWLVYDLGGGTFDVAIIKCTGGHLGIVDCGGDNDLGGKDFDWLVVERILIPALVKTFDLPELARSNRKTHGRLLAKLKESAEEAKITLTRLERTTVYLDGSVSDRSGRPVELSIPVSRQDYEPLIEPSIAKTLRLSQEIIARARLSPSAFERVILVGGPTMTPAIRAAIRASLNIPVDPRMDPITVVAQGAAIFASNQPFPHDRQIRSAGKLLVRLGFTALSQQPITLVAGRLEAEGEKTLPPDLRARLTRDDQGWQSGFLPVKEGAFVCQVSLRENQSNTFRLALFDGTGQSVPVEPDTLCITHGLSVANPPLQRTIGVEVVTESGQGRYDLLLARGTPLPAKATFTYQAARALQPGSSDHVVNIHLFEGEYENPQDNRHLGTLKILGTQVRRPVPLNTDIEVTLSVDASRHPTVRAYIPLLDQTFQDILTGMIAPKPNPEDLAAEAEKLEAQWEAVVKAAQVPSDTASQIDSQLTQVGVELAAAHGGDPGALEKADRLIREMRAEIANLTKASETPKLIADLDYARAETQREVHKHGNDGDHEQLRGLEADADRARERQDPRLCQDATKRLWSLYWQVRYRQDSTWIEIYQDLAERGRFTDPDRAQALMVECRRLLDAHQMGRFREVVRQLWGLVPEEAQEETKEHVSDAGIKRGPWQAHA
jgi:molecular chaperone DnaK